MFRNNQLISNIVLFALGTLASKFIMFIMLPFYTHILTPSQYGVVELIFTTVQLITPIVSIAIYNGELRYGLSINFKREEVAKVTFFIFVIAIIISMFLTPIICLFKPLNNTSYFLCLWTITYLLTNISLIYVKVCNQNKLYSTLCVIQTLLLVGLNIILLVIFPLGIDGYLYSIIISSTIVSIIALHYTNFISDVRSACLNKLLLKKMCIYSFPFVINDISWWAIHASDKYMLSTMVGLNMLGLYTAASKIPTIVNSISSIFSQAWMITAVNEHEKSNRKDYYQKVFKYYYLFLYFVSFVLIIVSKLFVKIYLGENYVDSWVFVPILILATVFGAIAAFTTSLFSALEKSKYIMHSTLVASLLNVSLNYILISAYGTWGACISTLIAYFTLALLRIKILRKFIDINFDLKNVLILSVLLTGISISIVYNYNVIFSSLIYCLFFIRIARHCMIESIVLLKQKFLS